MPNFFASWDAVLIILAMILLFAVLSSGVAVLVYMLTASFTPKVLGAGSGMIAFAALLLMFYRFLSN